MKTNMTLLLAPLLAASILGGCALTGSGMQPLRLRLSVPDSNRWAPQAVYPYPNLTSIPAAQG